MLPPKENATVGQRSDNNTLEFEFQKTPIQLIIHTHHKVSDDVAELHHKRKWKEIQRLVSVDNLERH